LTDLTTVNDHGLYHLGGIDTGVEKERAAEMERFTLLLGSDIAVLGLPP